ncbi:D-alanine--D-alanine ligase A [bacterium CG10_46_32]|nr:MAG: D-alanine--D-alanine ligase A [bacterium CG10_46_32]PIR55966.1 MAG: D-alanine--D-alanine ligase A [Parcubacteria group bacterium CG10_big_fil_rev_8_21_14_0_10_46_32]
MTSTPQKLRVAVLFGGRSGEHEVSLISASSVIKNLDPEKYEVVPIGITKEGRWIAGPDSLALLKSGKAPNTSNAFIRPEPADTNQASHNDMLRLGKIDVVFPVLHGPYGEDGTIQGFLELTGMPYVGCGVLGSSICMDKVVQKKVLEAEHIKQVLYVWFWASEWLKKKKDILQEFSLAYPVFVKPANMGSSVGISKVKNSEELVQAVEEALQYDRKVLIEQGVPNVREIEVAVLGNQEPRASVAGEIISSNEFYDYDAKYVDGKSKAIIPCKLSTEEADEIKNIAIATYKALNCEGMARVDFLLDSNMNMYLNEVNTIPGFTSISMYPKLWEASGLGYKDLLDELIVFALERSKEKKNLKVSYQPKQEWYTE